MVATSDACLFCLPQTSIPAYSTADLTLEYTPCSLSLLEEGMVRVESEDIGVHDFAVSGKGVPPVAAETTTLVAVLGTSSQGVVSWRNPFSEPVEASVGCSMSSHEIAMMLDEASTTQTVQPFAMLQVPLSFCPTSLRVATGDVTVTVAQPPGLISAEPLTWHMPVRGTAEAVQMTGTALKFRCKARATLDEVRPGLALLRCCNLPSLGVQRHIALRTTVLVSIPGGGLAALQLPVGMRFALLAHCLAPPSSSPCLGCSLSRSY